MSSQTPSVQRETVQVLDLPIGHHAPSVIDGVELRDRRAFATSAGFPRLFEEPPRFFLVRV